MKKIITSLLLISLVAFGCAKKRTCTETDTQNGIVSTSVTTYDKLTRKEMKDIENENSYVDGNGNTVKTTCK